MDVAANLVVDLKVDLDGNRLRLQPAERNAKRLLPAGDGRHAAPLVRYLPRQRLLLHLRVLHLVLPPARQETGKPRRVSLVRSVKPSMAQENRHETIFQNDGNPNNMQGSIGSTRTARRNQKNALHNTVDVTRSNC